MDDRTRCPWCGADPLYVAYHDEEWGTPSHDERHLFEMLILEGAQAGLAWITILRKRDGYRRVFDGFDAERLARWDAARIEAALLDPGIVRNRLKVQATVDNARAYLALRDEQGGLAPYLWRFVDGRPVVNAWRRMAELPASTPLSDAISKDLKKRGFRFVGSTIVYAYLQAIGIVDDHLESCWRRRA
jgi:DNA-3-methyladenine glycosylase I